MWQQLFKRLLPGLLPLLVFVVVDEYWGTIPGLVVAMLFGLGEIGWSLIRKEKVDRFVLVDVGLILLLGGVSIALDDDIFFKLKPGVVELIFAVFMGFVAFFNASYIENMSSKITGQNQLNPWQLHQMKQSFKWLFFVTVIHSILIFYTAIYSSKSVWVFVSGPLYYILVGAVIGIDFLFKWLNNKKYQHEKWLPLVNENGDTIGSAPRSVCHNKTMLMHPVVHLHVFKEGKIYLQKRPKTKKIQPNKWDSAVGGHVDLGEEILTAMYRETAEEIGLYEFKPILISNYVWTSKQEKELVFSFVTELNRYQEPNPHPEELDGGKFWSYQEVEENLGRDIFTPNFENEWNILKSKPHLKMYY